MPRKQPSNDTPVSDQAPEVTIEDSQESPETPAVQPVTTVVLDSGVKIEDF